MSSISVTPRLVRINDLEIDDEETVKIINEIEEKDLEQYVIKSINIGSSVLRNRMTTEKIDYVEKEFKRLLGEIGDRADDWDDLITDSMTDSLNPEKEGKPINMLRTSILAEFTKLRDIIMKKEGAMEESVKGTMKGFDFEDEIIEDMMMWQKYSDSFEKIGDVAEGKTRRKVGDVLATMENGMTIAMEAKAGSNYSDTGDKSLDTQMDQSMAYRDSSGSIAVTTVDAMEGKRWQNSIFLDRGKNRFIVAVDRENEDFTILHLAYMLLRERILASTKTDELPSQRTIDPKQIREITDDIVRDMSSATKMRQILTDVEGRINAMRDEISAYQGKIQGRIDELNALL